MMKNESTRIYSVVVVDRNREYREILLDLLARVPAIRVVAVGSNERDAVAFCAEQHPDILLLDTGIPGYGALNAAAAVKELRPGIYVVFMTTLETDAFSIVRGSVSADFIVSKSDIKSGINQILAALEEKPRAAEF